MKVDDFEPAGSTFNWVLHGAPDPDLLGFVQGPSVEDGMNS